ncbi:diguanylate cyclase [Synechocystis sp. LKSZ1]|uniref:diguanylate cyclase domain-containing protein n=1 Tax=Synechocystis sp. LKSZ1 TaxID=3144951 RepID=UPI00336BB961
MVSLKLRKILQKPEVLNLLETFEQVFQLPIAVYDLQGECLWGTESTDFDYRFSIHTPEACLGQVRGDQRLAVLAQWLSCLCREEWEKKCLAVETLQKYEEVNFLSDFSVKISNCTSLAEMTAMIYPEIQQLFQATQAFIVLSHSSDSSLEALSPPAPDPLAAYAELDAIFQRILARQETEIINDLSRSQENARGPGSLRSWMLAPLKTQNQTIGILGVAHTEPMQYSSEDLNLFITLSSQVAAAIQTAQYYEKLKEYSQTLEQRVMERTQELEAAKQQLEKANQELKRLAIYDDLTAIPNRRYFNQYIQQEWRRCLRDQQSLSLILCDVDYFKNYNDYYGHQAGDECLRRVAEVITQSLKRSPDLVARYGGEEFAIILPNTDSYGAYFLAERIQANLFAQAIPHCHSYSSSYLTLSLGIATAIPSGNSSLETLIKLADQALYDAKEQGRNQIRARVLSFKLV